ncbi:MAG: lysylphosphatidylglycerol synthase transmembrane domain-containing protein [Acidimicrobiales bacterium]
MGAQADEYPSGGAPATRHNGPRVPATRSRRLWSIVRYLLGIGVLCLALWVLSSHRYELSGFSHVLANLNWWWIPPAVVAEALSFVCFAALQQQFLRSGGLTAPRVPLLNMTFASQAMANSLPAGNAVAAIYAFRWYRRFGADDTLAAWSLAGTMVATAVTLSLVAAGGLVLATGEGASLDLVPVLIGVLLFTVALGVLFVYERPLFAVVSWAIRASRRLIGRPRGDTTAEIERIVAWVTTVRLGWRQIRNILLWGTANWLFDCACFAMMFWAIGSPVPWKGLLLAYGAGQLAATLPITPGGLGVVEGSITIALVAFGGVEVTTVDAVLLYRFISFWLVLVVGWALWGLLALQVRRGKWSRLVRDADIAAGPEVALRSRADSGAPARSPTALGT